MPYSFDIHKGNTMEELELFTLTQAAELLGVTRQTAHNMTKQGYGRRVGSMWVFTRDELDRWKATPRHGGGRPKSVAGTQKQTSPAI
jgi:excisionase family DNA binding protein